MKKLVVGLFILICLKPFAQDTLPKFSAAIIGNDKARISWTNPFPNCIQISVQRSYDSLKFYQTIFSSLSPELPQNGYIDNHFMKQVKIFYRIFYVLDNGKYFFTKSKQARRELFVSRFDTTTQTTNNKTTFQGELAFDSIVRNLNINPIDLANVPATVAIPIKKMVSVYRRNMDTLFNVFEEGKYQKFRDSIVHKTKDTLLILANDAILWKPFVPKPLWKKSLNIFTTDKGYVSITLPNFKIYRYKIIFYDDKEREIFRINELKQQKLMLEKSNFLHEGWFYFDLFEDDKLKEKNKFFIEKDF